MLTATPPSRKRGGGSGHAEVTEEARLHDDDLVALFTTGSERKRIRSALADAGETAARWVIRSAQPDVDSEVEDAIIEAVRESEAREALETQAAFYLEQQESAAWDDAEELVRSLEGLNLIELPCPMCPEGDLVQGLDRARFSCSSCSLFLRDAKFSSVSDVRSQLASVLAAHVESGCNVARPNIQADGKGGLNLACDSCGARNVIFSSA